MKTYISYPNKGNVTQRDIQFNIETNPNTDAPQTSHIVIPEVNDPFYKVKTENEKEVHVYTINASSTLTDTKTRKIANINAKSQAMGISEKNMAAIKVKKEFDKEPSFDVNCINANKIIKMETPTGWNVKNEPLDMVYVKIENESSEPNKPVELSDPSNSNLICNFKSNYYKSVNTTVKAEPIDQGDILHSKVECTSELVHETYSKETEELRNKLKEDKRGMNTGIRDKVRLSEEVVIKQEYSNDNNVDLPMAHKQTNSANAVANIKNEWIECSDVEVEFNVPGVECSGPAVGCGSESIECNSNASSNGFELRNDVDDSNKCHGVPTDEAPPPTPSRPPLAPPRTDALEPAACPACGAAFERLAELRAHLRLHAGAKPHRCGACGERFKHDFSLAAHMKQHGGAGYHCDQCNRQCQTKRGLARHLNTHTRERIFPCPQCQRTFTERSLLLNHLLKHTPHETHRCSTCGETFANAADLKTHSSIHLTFLACKVCGAKFGEEAALEAHVRGHSKVLECTFCLQQFKDAGELEAHTATHRDMLEKVRAAAHCCARCGAGFRYRSALAAHERAHGAARPFSCGACPQAFKTQGARNEHRRGHARGHPCNDCGKSFARPQTLELHRRTHTGEKPYSCHLCDRAFAQKYPLNNHLQRIHGHLKTKSVKKPRDQQNRNSKSAEPQP